MGIRVVCISATDGAGAEDVAPRVAEALGFEVVNEEVVARAAQEAGVDISEVADVEKRRSLIGRLIFSLPASGAGGAAYAGYTLAHDTPPPADSLRGLIRSVIEAIAERGSAVIVSHAASHALGGRDDVLRVLLTAPEEMRAGRIGAKEVARGDANRADYIKRFYKVADERPTHYDLVVNTDRITADRAVGLIVDAAR